MSAAKFKIGDRVRVNGEEVVPEGTVGTVVLDDTCPDVKWDGWTSRRSDGLWCGSEDSLELASPAAKFYVVLYHGDGKPSYDTKAIAEERAAKMASDYPGDGYAVLRIESVTTASAPPITVERF